MYQSPYNPNYIIPDMEKYYCYNCEAEFILSTQYDNSKAVCPHCQSGNIEGRVLMNDPDQLGELGCMAISLVEKKDNQGADSR